MPLGNNRRYNTVRGLPVKGGTGGQLSPTAPLRGTVALFGDGGLPVVVETVPKVATGLPGGSDVEQYIVDMSTCVWRLRVFAHGSAINNGDQMTHVVTAVAAAYAGTAKVGDLTNAGSTLANVTFGAIDSGREPIIMELVAGTTLASLSAGDADVIIGL